MFDFKYKHESAVSPQCPQCKAEPKEGHGPPFEKILTIPDINGHYYGIVICIYCLNVYAYIQNRRD